MSRAKKFLMPILAASLLASCGGGEQSSSQARREDGLIDLGPEFNEKYYPVLDSVDKELSGKITIALVFDGKEAGWDAVAREYERIHDGSVVVEINNHYDSETYPDAVKNVLSTGAGNPEWNIIQGNLLGGLDKTSYTVSMNASINAKNPYAGNKIWNTVLTGDAVDKTNYYILNSENLQTAWFVNTVAKEAAISNGYLTEDGTTSNPKSWADLVKLLDSMQQAGYKYPLGLSLDKDSINASQFSWLLRVYGDYYYRNEYSKIVDSADYPSWKVDVTSPDPDTGFKYLETRLFNLILDEGNVFGNYVGAYSEKFAEFIEQIYKLKQYINPNAITTTFKQTRDAFATQQSGNTKDAPQVMMDYLGSGLGFIANENDAYKIDFFDNPTMKSEGGFIEDDTLVRDVGGNGGFLSIARHSSSKIDKVSQDFLEFFMSPYGQSIYYDTLSKTHLYPQGITTVKNNLVLIPQNWKSFFENETISFSGQSDRNPFVSFLVRFMSTKGEKTNLNLKNYWANYLTKSLTTAEFQDNWGKDLYTDWLVYAQDNHWDPDCYMHPGGKTVGPWDD